MSYILSGDSGTVVFNLIGTVEDESVTFSNKATSNPIEGGSPINDHAVNDPIKFDISGITTQNNGREILEAMWKNCDLLSYRGEEAFDNLLILNMQRKRTPDNATGYAFSISFQRMQISSAEFVPITGPTMSQMDKGAKTKAKTKPKTEQGLQTTSTDYGKYVSSYDGPGVNTGITQTRSNPSNPGYGGR